ncbi:hypothetical protein GCM10023221_13000 [Luteimicrobium xylanilyticum]|uniref:Pyridoxine 4-dehydrogenase n=2 Tax=Luteimicrobium xylanilyticum TaxID=1133546 RepID=A0A5P9QCX1_9MICO|nr:Pyridoxine 4-dehydrogenase [Luteimicrobium xylanilyticum]
MVVEPVEVSGAVERRGREMRDVATGASTAPGTLAGHVGATETIEVRTGGPAGGPGRVTPIWGVVVDGRVYVRSSHGAAGRWYERARRRGELSVVTPGGDLSAQVVPVTDDATLDAVDSAYRRKYDDWPQYLPALVAAPARGNTLELVPAPDAAASGTFLLGGDLEVRRLGYGTMQLTGPGVWGPPEDRDQAVAVLRRAVELGVTLIDTADSYGPDVAEELVREALAPYPEDLVIATKVGFARPGPGRWAVDGRPERLRERAEGSLRRLGVERIDLLQLHRVDPRYPLEDQLGVLEDLQREGKVRHVGLSEVGVGTLEAALGAIRVVSVQNRYNLGDREAEDVLRFAEARGLAFVPWFPLGTGGLTARSGALGRVADALGAEPAQVALAWLLQRSPVMLPIPGTSSVTHLESNLGSASLELDEDALDALDAAAG